MINRPRLAMLTLILTAMPCFAQIKDEAGLFSAETIHQAETRINQIREQTGKQVAVWTLKAAPEELNMEFNLGDAGQRKDAYEKLARKRIEDTQLEGVLLLICEDPQYITIATSPDSEALFGKWYRDELKSRMTSKFHPNTSDQHWSKAALNKLRGGPKPDKGLIAALDYVGAKLDYNRHIDQTNLYLGLAIMGCMLGGWVFLGVVRGRLRKRGPVNAGVHDADDSGRSIAVLGGGIGAVGGLWLVNRVFARRAPAEQPHDATVDLPPPPPEDSHG